MRCGAAILVETRRRKGNGKEYQKITMLTSRHWLRQDGTMKGRGFDATTKTVVPYPITLEHLQGKPWVVCDGEIEVTVEARDEPTWGGTSAVLEVMATCKKCGNTHFPEIPGTLGSAESLSAFLTKHVADREDPWRTYDQEYGDDRPCAACSHPYYRHFDWGHAYASGCKYCECPTFMPGPTEEP